MGLLEQVLAYETPALRPSAIALAKQEQDSAAMHAVRNAASTGTESLLEAALTMLEKESNPRARMRLYARLVESPDFLLPFASTGVFTREQLIKMARRLLRIDHLLDIRLARLAPGRNTDEHGLGPDAVLQILDLLNEISPGPRLILMLSHLTSHPNERIASKAAILMGKRIRSSNWVEKQLESTDPRVRASVVESLWRIDTPATRRTIWACLKDDSNRVAGNAVFGLHLLGDPRAVSLARTMIVDSRAPFRQTAVWVMGQMGKPELLECVEGALTDSAPGVRKIAAKVAAAMRSRATAETTQLAALAGAIQPEAKPGEAPLAPAEKPAEEKEEAGQWSIRLDGRYVSSR